MSDLAGNPTRQLLITPVRRGSSSIEQVRDALRQIAPTVAITPAGPSLVATLPISVSDDDVRAAVGDSFFVAPNQRLRY